MPRCSSEFTPRWTGDFAALVVTTRVTINDWEFSNGIYVADHYDDGVLKPIYLHMERPNCCTGWLARDFRLVPRRFAGPGTWQPSTFT